MTVVVNTNERIDKIAENFRLPENNPRKDRYIKTALLHCHTGQMRIQLGKIYSGRDYTPNQEEVKRGLCYGASEGLIVEVAGRVYLTPGGAKIARGHGFRVPNSAVWRD